MERPSYHAQCQCGMRIHRTIEPSPDWYIPYLIGPQATFETKEVPGSSHHGRVALHREDSGARALVVEVALVVATWLGDEKIKENNDSNKDILNFTKLNFYDVKRCSNTKTH